MPRHLDIACLQTRPMATMAEAIAEAMPLAETAARAGAEMLFLPEYCSGLKSEGARLVPPVAAFGAHPFVQEFQTFAAANNVWVMLGSMAIEGQRGKFVNQGAMIDPTGDVIGTYDKIHLFDIQLSENEVYRESATVEAGTRAVIHDTGIAQIGHTICYDLRFPDLFRALAKGGAEILAVPSAFTQKTGEAHWHALLRARAIETGCFVVAPCAIGPIPGGGSSYGHSLVVDPWGDIIADGGDLPGVVRAQIDLDQVAEVRARIPSLDHDRPFAVPGQSKRHVA